MRATIEQCWGRMLDCGMRASMVSCGQNECCWLCWRANALARYAMRERSCFLLYLSFQLGLRASDGRCIQSAALNDCDALNAGLLEKALR